MRGKYLSSMVTLGTSRTMEFDQHYGSYMLYCGTLAHIRIILDTGMTLGGALAWWWQLGNMRA